jgi:hypothetical protein
VKTIKLKFCELDWIDGFGAKTRFPDGTQYGATPHPDKSHYQFLAYRYGHEGDVVAYCQFHELAHHVAAEAFGSHSLVLWSLAHGEQPTPLVSAAEEALAMCLHRYAMTNEPPMVDCVPWAALKTRFLSLAELGNRS